MSCKSVRFIYIGRYIYCNYVLVYFKEHYESKVISSVFESTLARIILHRRNTIMLLLLLESIKSV